MALILESLDDDKASAIRTIPLAGKSPMADYMIVASGTSTRHVATMADHLHKQIKDRSGRPPRIEGRQQNDWVLVDAGDIIVHLFRPEIRDHYNLEKLWDGEIVSHAAPHDQPLETTA